MAPAAETADVVLIVDDEESVRRTVRDWLTHSELRVRVLSAADPEEALRLANAQPIDLAILDWNLGAGLNGLELLQDLYDFNSNIIAIMITAYADQATPLDAMRCGVRDYLDKNQEFTRDKFLAAVQKQLSYIRPAKRERYLNQSLRQFRDAVGKILPLVQSLAALNDPVTLPEVISSFFRFVLNAAHASDGVLLVRHYDTQRPTPETCRVYSPAGLLLNTSLVPFARSAAATAISMQEPCLMVDLDKQARDGTVQLQSFEQGHYSLLAAPLAVAPGLHVVLELFDRQTARGEVDPAGFAAADVALVRDASLFGAEMLRQALAQRQSHQVLLEAVAAALHASETVAQSLQAPQGSAAATPDVVLDQLRQGLAATTAENVAGADSVRLAEAIRLLAVRHGTSAVRHCIQLVESLCDLLDRTAGVEPVRE